MSEQIKTFLCRKCGSYFDAPKYIENKTRSVSPCCSSWFDRVMEGRKSKKLQKPIYETKKGETL